MSKPNVTWAYNSGASDDGWADAPNAGGDWVLIDLTADHLMFLDSQQNDGDPASATLYPAIIPSSGEIEVPKTFIKNASVLDQVPLAGTTDGGQSGGATRYVFGIFFSGATAGVPKLEAWDDDSHATADSDFLGGGTAAESTLRAISTTSVAPGSPTWAGTPLAGADSALDLDGGPLSGAKTLYFNIKQVIPSTFTPQQNSSIVLALRFTYS